MRQLIYVSSATAVTGCPATEMQTILETARTFNRAHDIAGLLLYRHFNFMQVLEGPQAVVEDLFFKHIVNDRRHCNILLLRNEEVAKPSFPHWAMSFDAVSMTVRRRILPVCWHLISGCRTATRRHSSPATPSCCSRNSGPPGTAPRCMVARPRCQPPRVDERGVFYATRDDTPSSCFGRGRFQ